MAKRLKPAKVSKESKSSLPPELIQLEELVGEFMQYWGFKKIHGRIWTHLFTSNQALDTAQLMERLKVSKGLMSLALRDLLEYRVIQSVTVGKHGTVFYQANPDLQDVINNVLRSREAQMMSSASQVAKRLLAVRDSELERAQISKERVQAVMDLTESAQSLLQAYLAMGPMQNPALFNPLLNESEW